MFILLNLNGYKKVLKVTRTHHRIRDRKQSEQQIINENNDQQSDFNEDFDQETSLDNTISSEYTSSESDSSSVNSDSPVNSNKIGFVEALRLLEKKSRTNMTEQMYQEIMINFCEQEISLYQVSKKLENFVQIKPEWIDCCIKSCYAFTGSLKNAQNCLKYNEPRYIKESNSLKSHKKMAFFFLKDRLLIQYQDSIRSQTFQYRYEYTIYPDYINEEKYGDIFDGKRYKDLVAEGHFSDYQDIALTASLDDYQIFKQKTDDYELKVFEVEGIECYDGFKEETFTLRCSVVSWSGDTPALAKLMYTIGHNSYKGCRYCEIHGVYHNHVYFPTTPPKKSKGIKYIPVNLPKKTHITYLQKIRHLSIAQNSTQKKKLESETGITGKSILFELKSTQFPDSFTLDIMHLLYENIPSYMFKHWSNSFYNNKSFNDEYILPKNTWTLISKQMEMSKKTMLSNFGRSPRNIAAHHEGFKAEEWANWIVLYSIPLLKNHLSRQIIKGWKYFVDAVRLCQKFTIKKNDLMEIQQLILAFYKHYEMTYYQYEAERLPAMKISFHYLLHLVDIQSKLHLYENLVNNITLRERFNHLQFYHTLQAQVFPPKSSKIHNENQVYINENYAENLYFPSSIHYLNKSTLIKLKRHYYSVYEINTNEEEFPENGIKYTRLQSRNGTIIRSKWGRRNRDFSRINYTVAVKMQTDKYAAFPNRESVFEVEEFYCCIEYFMVHNYKEKSIIVTYVQWTKQVLEDEWGTMFFKGYGVK
ncbi:transposase domain-containing protein [Rhizophagus clarus]|uniref:Transposase domain-containing protein n=1 Tax=Rhizophagus clarus TaxID=94130 RepID=A0A8H3LP78_9GLOM|nr:transposase domain-containing protein [Rhizophagus clarus]